MEGKFCYVFGEVKEVVGFIVGVVVEGVYIVGDKVKYVFYKDIE